MLDTTDCNYKLRSESGLEDNSTATRWTRFNKQVRDTFLCTRVISRALVDCANMETAIGCILDKVYTPSVSMRDSVGSTTSFFHTSMVLHPGSDDHLCILKSIHEGLLYHHQRNIRTEKFH